MMNVLRCVLSLIVVGAAGPASAGPGEKGLEAAAKDFVALLAREDFPAAVERFDATMTRVMPAAKLKAVWKTVTQQLGPFQRPLGVQLQTVRQFRVAVVACQFAKAALDVKVVFDKQGKVAGLFFAPNTSHTKYRPPKYARRDAFAERQVQVGSGEWALGGTLAVPKQGGPFAAVVLVHGSGPHDRDETVFAHKPFRDLAWGLATRGIAVLRYDKRSKIHAQKMATMTTPPTVKEEVIDDCLAAVALLRKTPQIDKRRIFVLGHSLGGMLAPRIARRGPGIAGLIILAGPTRPLEDLMLEQISYLARLDGSVSAEEQEQINKVKAMVQRVKGPKLSPTTPAKELPGAPAAYWLDLRGYNPAEAAKALPRPMLILQGGRDYQVTVRDFEGWRKHLSARRDVQLKLYPDLNHLFVAGKGKSQPAEYFQPGNVSEAVVDDIARWIQAQKGTSE